MNCKICNKPIRLIPSARERARKHGGRPSDYTRLFTTHTACEIEKRKEDTSDLIRRINDNKPRPVMIRYTGHLYPVYGSPTLSHTR